MATGEDIATSLQNYQIQLQQVEAALTTDPENEELLKLRKDLQEVITLTKELLNNDAPGAGASTSTSTISEQGVLFAEHSWKPGERCMAPWSDDGQYYEATIDEITEDGQCTVTFSQYGNTDVAMVSQLKHLDGKRGADAGEGGTKSKKQIIQAQREYKKKKAQKKASRLKQLEEEREKEKEKWQVFNSKALTKSRKGQVKKSIFASPDNINGRVGVGTCGIGGKPMTEYHQQEKWRRPMAPPRPLD